MLLLCASPADVPDVTGNRLSWTQVQDVGSTAQAGGFINNAAYAALFFIGTPACRSHAFLCGMFIIQFDASGIERYWDREVGRRHNSCSKPEVICFLSDQWLQSQLMEWHNGKSRLYISIVVIIFSEALSQNDSLY